MGADAKLDACLANGGDICLIKIFLTEMNIRAVFINRYLPEIIDDELAIMVGA